MYSLYSKTSSYLNKSQGDEIPVEPCDRLSFMCWSMNKKIGNRIESGSNKSNSSKHSFPPPKLNQLREFASP